ncbi:hypothetical protein C8F01DRAFT_1126201 [Mycena amicta]|nr:hypothetical protein C8F01DRAFT_1126201 [Mycena amicta]
MSVTDTRLPLELEREIFVYTAKLFPDTIPSLLCIAHRVLAWIEPIAYRTIQVNQSKRFSSFLAITKSKSPEFFAKHVQRILIDIEGAASESIEDVCAALALCTNVTRIAGARPPLSRVLLPVIAPMRLERIALFLTHIFSDGISEVDLSLPCFQTLTHFDVFDHLSLEEDDAMLYATKLCALPVLTHLSLNDMVPWEAVQKLLQGCRCLQMLVVQWSESAERGQERAAQTPFDDVRFIMTLYGQMEDAVLDAPNFWSQAEAFIADKRRGNIDSRRFWMVRDMDNSLESKEDSRSDGSSLNADA